MTQNLNDTPSPEFLVALDEFLDLLEAENTLGLEHWIATHPLAESVLAAFFSG